MEKEITYIVRLTLDSKRDGGILWLTKCAARVHTLTPCVVYQVLVVRSLLLPMVLW